MDGNQSANNLNSSVLVLNRLYMAVHVVSVRRALVLLYRESAEVIHVEEGIYSNFDFDSWRDASLFFAEASNQEAEWIRGVGFSLQVPRVVRLNRYDKVPKQTLRFNRRHVFARDENTCQYCGADFSAVHLSLDHIMPRSRGGQTNWENVVCCCLSCNTKKGNRTPKEANMRLIRPPKKPRHSPILKMKLDNPKYAVWRNFVQHTVTPVDVA